MLPRQYFLAICVSLGGLGLASAHASAQVNPLNDLLAMQMNWDASRSDDNAKPSVTLRFVPFGSHKQDGKSFTSYYLYAPGLPSNKPYTLITWQIGWDAQQPPFQPVRTDLYINARGVVMCRRPTEKEINSEAPEIDSDARLEVISAGSMGEPVRYALLSQEQTIVAMGRLIVNPIKFDDRGCHLQAILAVGGAEIVLVEGTGFAPKTSIELSKVSDGKAQTAAFRTDENGRLETVAILAKQGESHGSATISMKSNTCEPVVKLNWGRDTYRVQ